MSVMARRRGSARREANRCTPVAIDRGAVDEMLASACQNFAAGVVVTRLTDDAGIPIGYVLTTSDDAVQGSGEQEHPAVERRGTRAA